MTNPKRISDFWRREYSNEVDHYDSFEVSQQFKRIASLFTPGLSYFYILNVHNLELDYVSSDVSHFVGLPSKKVTIEKLLATATPEELEWIEKKEKVVKDFYGRYLPEEEVTNYKLVYSYKMKDFKNKKRVMLHQATPLSVTEKGVIQHVLSIHTDISHLTSKSTTSLSFINLEGENSFYNINPKEEIFEPSLANCDPVGIFNSLTDRQRDVLELMAKGYNAQKMAEKLHISVHTVQTHRKNILKKSGCQNSAEVIAESMMAGLIGPS